MDIEGLAVKAAQVSSEYEASVDAIAARNRAEAELLDALIAKVKPALRALSSRIQADERVFWPDNTRSASEKTWRAERGLCVAGDDLARYDYPRANRGSFEGTGLWLLTDGTFAKITYSGSWSRWQGEGMEWLSKLEPRAVVDVAAEYDVGRIVSAIAEALDKQLGTREKTVKTATERAEKVRALASLLGGGK